MSIFTTILTANQDPS